MTRHILRSYVMIKADSFDGICNHAMHLFTEHKAIRTEHMNINFIFSGMEAKLTQWAYLYSRLPYLLLYVHRIAEYITANIVSTKPEYLANMDRRIAALTLLWRGTVDDKYVSNPLEQLVIKTFEWLAEHCSKAGCRSPSKADLENMQVQAHFLWRLFNFYGCRMDMG